jgi:hypothetical protein
MSSIFARYCNDSTALASDAAESDKSRSSSSRLYCRHLQSSVDLLSPAQAMKVTNAKQLFTIVSRGALK